MLTIDFSAGTFYFFDEESIPWILNHIDCFKNQCRATGNVMVVCLSPYELYYGLDDQAWDKLRQGIASLRALRTLQICTPHCYQFFDDSDYDNEDVPALSWSY
jgi:hypothetical protein